MAGIRKAGSINNISEFLLERANFYRHQLDYEKAEFDLEEAQEIIDRCGMKLYAVDAALLRGNLLCDKNQNATEEYKTAKALIEITGYHLRDNALKILEKRI